MAMEYALFKTGPLTMPPSQLGAFSKKIRVSRRRISSGTCSRLARQVRLPLHISCHHSQRVHLRPASRGWVRIASSDPAAHPEIKLNYLDEPVDRRVVVDAMRCTRRIMAAKALAKFEPEEFRPDAPLTVTRTLRGRPASWARHLPRWAPAKWAATRWLSSTTASVCAAFSASGW
jgi:choline dehydrogenase